MQRKSEWLEICANEGRAGVEARVGQRSQELDLWKQRALDAETSKDAADALWRDKVQQILHENRRLQNELDTERQELANWRQIEYEWPATESGGLM